MGLNATVSLVMLALTADKVGYVCLSVSVSVWFELAWLVCTNLRERVFLTQGMLAVILQNCQIVQWLAVYTFSPQPVIQAVCHVFIKFIN